MPETSGDEIMKGKWHVTSLCWDSAAFCIQMQIDSLWIFSIYFHGQQQQDEKLMVQVHMQLPQPINANANV